MHAQETNFSPSPMDIILCTVQLNTKGDALSRRYPPVAPQDNQEIILQPSCFINALTELNDQ